MAIGEIAPLTWAIREQLLELREELLFTGTLDDVHVRCERARSRLAVEWQAAGAERRAQIVELLAELTIDMRSYLPHWHLPAAPGLRAAGMAAFEQQARANEALCRTWSAAAVGRIARESDALQRSSMRHVAELTDAGVLANRFGNDSPHGVCDALRRGAILVTTNPVMANNARRVEAAHWEPVRKRLRRAAYARDPAQRVMQFTWELVLDVARELRPIYRASGRRHGHVTYQVNPHRSDAADEMVAEAEQVWAWAAERLGGDPNVMFKVPGTEAGLAAAERLAAQGIPLTITASCSVAQHLAFARVLERGSYHGHSVTRKTMKTAHGAVHGGRHFRTRAPCLLVQMNGRLDEPVAEELAAHGIAGADAVSRWASIAIVRRSYRLLHDVNRWRKSHLLVASLRGPWHIAGALAAGPEPIFITAFPDQAAEYDHTRQTQTPVAHQEIPARILDLVARSRRFVRAYEPDGMTVAEFRGHHTVARTLQAFREAYDELAAYLA